MPSRTLLECLGASCGLSEDTERNRPRPHQSYSLQIIL